MSWVLLALAAVGRIILARKPSSAPPLVDARDVGRLVAAELVVLGASEARDACFRAAGAAFGAVGRVTVDGLRASFWAPSSSCFAADDAVGAIK